MKITTYIFFVVALFIQSCSSDDGPTTVCVPATVAEQDQIIDDYIADNGLTMQTTASGLRYSIETLGAGDNIAYGDVIEVEYKGTLLNGSPFDAGTLGPAIFNQGSFIPGFEEGLLLLNEGSEGLFILPGALAYGCFPPQGSIIGDNEILIFEMTIVSINP
jgi:FKBP-type peptidyl-prolyl cis-trans isomerase FkpA